MLLLYIYWRERKNSYSQKINCLIIIFSNLCLFLSNRIKNEFTGMNELYQKYIEMVNILVKEFIRMEDLMVAPKLICTLTNLQEKSTLALFRNLETIKRIHQLFNFYADQNEVLLVDNLLKIMIGISSSENPVHTNMLLDNEVLSMVQVAISKQFEQCQFHCIYLLFNISIGTEEQKKRLLA